MVPSYQMELNTAITAVLAASAICQSVQAKITAESLEKKDQSPVTIADYASQAVICREILNEFPGELIVGEEDSGDLRDPANEAFLQLILDEVTNSGVAATKEELLQWIDAGGHDGTANRYWTLDPIDGTKGFLRKEQYAISLALLVDHQIEIAALACPNLPFENQTGAVFYSVRGSGSFAIPLSNPSAYPTRIKVSKTAQPELARMCESVESGHSAHDKSSQILHSLKITAEPVRMDSQAKYATVAEGNADFYLRLPTRKGYEEKIWDHAGGVLVLEEAGGRVTDIDGKPLDFAAGRTLKNNRGVVVSNGLLHDAILAAIQANS